MADADRIDELDMLRGVALLGVLLVNFVAINGPGVMATQAQLGALPTATADHWADLLLVWLVRDKANTLFAMLFGLGFALQMVRNADRPGFVPRFRRRLWWLLLFGVLNGLLLWVWDILHLYALAGFVLLACRQWSVRRLALVGAGLALLDVHALQLLAFVADARLLPFDPFTTADVLARQAASQAGDYGRIAIAMARINWAEWLVGGGFLGWFAYALGRFMLGAAIGRSGLLDDIPRHLPLLRRVADWTMPTALALSLGLGLVLTTGFAPFGEHSRLIAGAVRPAAALLQSSAYACLLILAWHRPAGRSFLDAFRCVGQMALTNYLMQGLFFGLLLFGVGPGLGLAGRIGSALLVLMSLSCFSAQILFSRWWLARYRFGPMEWLWRWLTYGGARPQLRRALPAGAPHVAGGRPVVRTPSH